MKMYIAGEWTDSPRRVELRSPYDDQPLDTVPAADTAQVELALSAAVQGAEQMSRLTAYERQQIMNRAADLVEREAEDLARTASREMGKPIGEARIEAARTAELFRLCGFEGAQLRGETLPLDAQKGATGKLGFTWREPCGIVVAISPFNYPLLLVAHKIGPALAAGNAVILKPSHQASLSALKLTKLMIEAGLPALGLQCILGDGSQVGAQLCADARVRKITFTGSTHVGEAITKIAGVKKVTLELGSNSPLIVLPDADLELAADATAVGGYANAGQVCISTQRIMVHAKVYSDFLDLLKSKVEKIKMGDPNEDDTKLGVMVSAGAADRVHSWLSEARDNGARLLLGGKNERAKMAPAIVAEMKPEMRIFHDEIFGPAVGVMPVKTVEEAIALANDSRYGLSAGIFTSDIKNAFRFAKSVKTGNVMINWTPMWRADFMPYGGFKQSGIGREGPRYAIEEMTEIKTVVVHGLEP